MGNIHDSEQIVRLKPFSFKVGGCWLPVQGYGYFQFREIYKNYIEEMKLQDKVLIEVDKIEIAQHNSMWYRRNPRKVVSEFFQEQVTGKLIEEVLSIATLHLLAVRFEPNWLPIGNLYKFFNEGECTNEQLQD